MATEEEMYSMIGRAVVDAEFRKKLMEDPEAAAKEAGYTVSAEQVATLKSAEGQGLAAVLEDRLPKSVMYPSPA
jgi:Ribosomally synthesized peptide prototyped by Frankia Franean1_4349.